MNNPSRFESSFAGSAIFAAILLVAAAAAIALVMQNASKSPVVSQIQPSTQLAQVISAPTSGLVGYWTFDEGSGTTANDSSGNGNTATFSGSPSWKAGKIGGALSFNGSSYLNLPTSSSLAVTGSQTLSAWINPSNASGNGTIIIKGSDSGSSYGWGMGLYYYGASGTVNAAAVTTNPSTSELDTPQATIAPGQWHLVTAVWNNGSSLQLYVDGVLVQSITTTSTTLRSANTSHIGLDSASGYFNGLIDDVRIYGRALSASEVSSIYAYTGSGGTVTPPTDTTAPSVPTGLTSSNITQTGVTISWTASTDASGITKYNVYRNGSLVGSPTATTYNDSGLTAGQAYSYTVSAIDVSSNANQSSQSTALSVTTSVASTDTTSPIISSVLTSSITFSGATIVWITNENSDSQVFYGLTTAYGSQTTLNSSLTTSHSQTLSGLNTNTVYHYQVKSKDAAGNLASSGDYTFTTLTNTTTTADTTAPSVPTNLAVVGSPTVSSVSLSWTASTDNSGGTGVAGYKIYRGSSQIGTSATNSYTDSTVSQSSTYSYTIATYDNASPANVSSQSTPALSVKTPAQTTQTGVLIPADRTIDWSQAGVLGGIPNRTTICATLGTSGGNSSTVQGVTVAQINSAIAACSNGVVYLNPGTYTVTGTITINKSNVTLRGAGPSLTIIKNTAGSSPLINLGPSYSFGSAVAISGSPSKGSTSLTLSSVSGISAGTYLMVDQLNESDSTLDVSIVGQGGSCTWCDYLSNGTRAAGQTVRVTAVSGNTVTISPSLYWNYSASLSPQVHAMNNVVEYSGLEGFDIQNINPNTGSNSSYNISLSETAYSWLKNIESYNSPNAHVEVTNSYRPEIRDSYFHDQPQYIPNRDGDIILASKTSGALIENNILNRLHSSMMIEWGASGNVFAYNYSALIISDDAPYSQLPDSTGHGAHPMFNLWEGNDVTSMVFDDYWGSYSHDVILRNNISGYNPSAAFNRNISGLAIQGKSQYFSVIGNILGSTKFFTSNPDSTWMIIYPDEADNSYHTGNDGKYFSYLYKIGFSDFVSIANEAVTTLKMGGNFDYMTNETVWSDNAPSHTPAYPIYLSRQSIPSSLFLSSSPTTWWSTPWGTPKWPPIGPDVSANNKVDPNGYADKIPSRLCYENTIAKGTAFEGSTCYPNDFGGTTSSGGTTVPPTVTTYAVSTSVTSGSGTITCGGTTCPTSVNAGKQVVFTENPGTNTFSGWGGACSSSGAASTCTVTVNANISVTAGFGAVVADTVAPSVPTNLTIVGSPTSSSISLSWTASTDNTGGMGVAGYKIYRGGTQISTSATNSYTDSTVSQSSTYSYTVAAYDNASPANTSSQSTPVLSATTPAAQTTTAGAFPSSDRTIDWSKAGVSGGIPNRTTICQTLGTAGQASTYAQSVSLAAINSALSSCSNGVVYLNAGTYGLSSGGILITTNNMTLRGAGPDKTILKFTGGNSCGGLWADVCIMGNGGSFWWWGTAPGADPSHIKNWVGTNGQTGVYTKGATVINLDSAPTGLAVGQTLVLDQADDTTDTGGIYVSSQINSASLEGCTNYCGRGGVKAQQQYVTVTAISGTQVTISPGIYMTNWRSSQSPQVWWWGSSAQGVGIEDITLDHSSGGTIGLAFAEASNSWMKDVRSYDSNRDHVNLFYSSHIGIQDSYFYGTQNGASQSYGVETQGTSDDLIANNIFQHVAVPFIMGPGTEGLVGAYNYTIDDYFSNAPNYMSASVWLHDAGSAMNLFEGNNGPGFMADDFHGSSALTTVFRNAFTGYESGKTAQTNAITVRSPDRFMNIVDNILGTSGVHTHYQNSPGLSGAGEPSVYILGYGDSETSGTVQNDSNVMSTILRGGNYDYVTKSVVWSSNAPSGTNPSTYLSQQTLPSSLFLSSKPSWWNSSPWPPIGSDVSGMVNTLPAQQCFNALAVDSTNYPSVSPAIKTFNGSTCYPGDFNGSGTVSTPTPTYTITPSAGANGAISPSSAVTLNSGSNQTLTITPNTGYQVNSVTDNGTAVSIPTAGGTYALSNVTANHTISASFSAIVTNQAPVLSAIGNKTVNENTALTFTISATDADAGDTLSYSASGLPTGATFNASTRTFSWTPSYTQSGSYTGVTFAVNDGKGGTDSEAITITVSNVNRSPTANAGNDQTVTLSSGGSASASLSGSNSSDPDNNTLTYSWARVSGPTSYTFSNATAINPTVTFTTSGTYIFSLIVSDGSLSSPADNITVTVNPATVVITDTDGDGIPDSSDKCAGTPTAAAPTVNTVGCPLPKTTKFTSVTNLSNVDLNAVSSLDIANASGKVSYASANGPYVLLGTGGTQLNIDSNLSITPGTISLNSSAMPQLNKPATLTFYNVVIPTQTLQILRDNSFCDSCTIVSYNNNTLVITVPGFSSYSIISDVTPPTVSVSAPADGSSATAGSIALTASASDNVDVSGVSFFADGFQVGSTVSDAPYSVSWDAPVGAHTIDAVAYDSAGNHATSSDVHVTIIAAVTGGNNNPGGGCPGCGGGGSSGYSFYTLTVTKQGTGLGTATSSPYGITCGTSGYACSASFVGGSTVVLNALPQLGSHLLSWTGCTSIATSSCTVSLTGPKTITVNFALGAATTTITNIAPVTTNAPVNCPAGLICTPSTGAGTSTGIPSNLLNLSFGTSNSNVVALQNLLIQYGYLKAGLNTGYYGALTQAAVNAYRAAQATTITNVPTSAATPTLSGTFIRTLKIGSTGADVKALQVFLNTHGFTIATLGNGSLGHETTYYGPATAAAVSRFQLAHAAEILAPYGLTQGTGNFGAGTMRVVNSIK